MAGRITYSLTPAALATVWPSQQRAARQSEKPLAERRIADTANLLVRHRRESRHTFAWVMSRRERCLVLWADRLYGKRTRFADSRSTLAPERWLAESRRRAIAEAGRADALDIALAALKRALRKRSRQRREPAAPAVARVEAVEARETVTVFDALAYAREYASAHNAEARALMGDWRDR